jgi:hypothetical protein
MYLVSQKSKDKSENRKDTKALHPIMPKSKSENSETI